MRKKSKARFSRYLIHPKKLKYADFSFFGAAAILAIFGLLCLYSASAIFADITRSDSLYYLKKQIVWLFLGIVLGLVALQINYEKLRKYSPHMVGATILLSLIHI